MTSEIVAGQIKVTDIEELNAAVSPWNLRMTQMGCGQLSSVLDFAMVGGILLTHERWSRSISAIGTTPIGYFAIASSCTQKPFLVDGSDIGPQTFLCKSSGSHIEFATPDTEEHWVMLVPSTQIVERLGEERAELLLRQANVYLADPHALHRLGALVLRVVAKMRERNSCEMEERMVRAFHSKLMENLIELLTWNTPQPDLAPPSKRTEAVHEAVRLTKELRHPVGVGELAARIGVSRRCLEIGFRDMFNASPSKYLRLLRLNGLHRDLRDAAPEEATVSELATGWGFFELGRTAVQYRQIFGEMPSETLKRNGRQRVIKLADALTV